MLLDSGNISSDKTFYTQSQIMVEKVTIPWRRQRDSAENSGTFPPLFDSVCRMFRQKFKWLFWERFFDFINITFKINLLEINYLVGKSSQNVPLNRSAFIMLLCTAVKVMLNPMCKKGLTRVYITFQYSSRPAYPRLLRPCVVGGKLDRGLGFPVLPLPGYRGFPAQIRPERKAETTAFSGLSSEEGPHQPVSQRDRDKFKFILTADLLWFL